MTRTIHPDTAPTSLNCHIWLLTGQYISPKDLRHQYPAAGCSQGCQICMQAWRAKLSAWKMHSKNIIRRTQPCGIPMHSESLCMECFVKFIRMWTTVVPCLSLCEGITKPKPHFVPSATPSVTRSTISSAGYTTCCYACHVYGTYVPKHCIRNSL